MFPSKSKVGKYLIALALVWTLYVQAQNTELRGVWIAWAGSNVPSKTKIAAMMEDIAAHNLNTVYVDVWRYGYPYYRSDLFYQHTGYYTDPALDEGRDVLAEMIAEGHRCDLQVEAWFEYGFVGCQGNNDLLFQAHPDWFARKKDGSVLFNGDYRYKWLSHVNPHAQQFLIDLCQEVALNYDVDGIELDRIRYPEVNCGYDSATVARYQAEHDGAPPPQEIWNRAWMEWRAEKLTEFVALFYDSLKSVRPDLPISNAPIVYPYGFENFCQDWRPWINNGYLDFISPQIYRATDAIYRQELDRQLAHVVDSAGFYPGLTAVTDNAVVETAELIAMIASTRQRGLGGHVIWFYDALADDLGALRDEVYAEPAAVPHKPAEWRLPTLVINEDDSIVMRKGGWIAYTALSGFRDGCLYDNNPVKGSLVYPLDVPKEGWFELYHYNISHWNATQSAAFVIEHAFGQDTVTVDMSLKGRAGWYKIGDFYFIPDRQTPWVKLTDFVSGNRILFADALLVMNSNRLKGTTGDIDRYSPGKQPDRLGLLNNYPNPFNASTLIVLEQKKTETIALRVFDSLGREVESLYQGILLPGRHQFSFNGSKLASGLYLAVLQCASGTLLQKMLLLK
ncbi:family 10 glycosylhydrolase [candidate division KSB1 bacterium]|nr:family 10 glycosylhydrolase [candidate division KSB1 bacterium]